MIKLDDGKIFTDSTTPPALAKIFVTQMLTRDLFAVANLLLLNSKQAVNAKAIQC